MSIATLFETLDYGPAPEADGEVQAWLKAHDNRFGHFIDGKWRKGSSFFETIDPATGKLLAFVAQGNAADIDAAVTAASAARKSWMAMGGEGRARHLYALARMVQKHARLFAVLETLDNGKPIREARDIDVPLVARHFYHHAGWAQLQDTELAAFDPIGVIGQIVPWNFPLLMLAWKIAPALALGNTVVLKPAEFTPLTALLFAELAHQSGLPPGVLNIVTGDGTTGAALVEHKNIDKIAFTGSTEVGRIIREKTAGTGKSLTLELGGKGPYIVFDDADIDGAIEGLVDAIWFNQGQVCCAGSRLILQEGIAATFIARLKRRMENLRIGSPLDKAIDIGAIIAPVQLKRIEALVAKGREEGGDVFQPTLAMPKTGSFYPPTLITNVHAASTVMREEIFGPVLVSTTFRTPDEAVALANNSRYGLGASIWSETIGLALDIAPQIKCGVVWINGANMFDAGVGFGGYRESGFGREGGIEGLYDYLKPKIWTKPVTAKTVKPKAVKPLKMAADTIDRTAKLYVNGKQTRPDGGYSTPVINPAGQRVGEVSDGNRKDIREAVEAARKAEGWSNATHHNRAQVLYYLGENLSIRADEFAHRIMTQTCCSRALAHQEVDATIRRLFAYGAWCDKFEGVIHNPPMKGLALAVHEPMGVVGIVAPPTLPLLGFLSLAAPALAMGNRIILVPSEAAPLSATDFYQVLETSDVPAGAFNIVTGKQAILAKTLAQHTDIDALWAFGSKEIGAMIEKESIVNLKRTFTDLGRGIDWFDRHAGEGRLFLRQAVQVKNIWIPYGE
jgi:aldehyde dehydrogenase (NAD+)